MQEIVIKENKNGGGKVYINGVEIENCLEVNVNINPVEGTKVKMEFMVGKASINYREIFKRGGIQWN